MTEKSLKLHHNNKNTAVVKAVLTLKPKPVVEEPVKEPEVYRRKKPTEVFNDKAKTTAKPVFTVTLKKPKSAHTLRSEEFLVELKKKFDVIAKHLPLEMGVAKQLYPHFPDTPRRVINTALYIHTHSELYVEFLSKGQGRFNLEGQFVAAINEEGVERALILLGEIQKKRKQLKMKLKRKTT